MTAASQPVAAPALGDQPRRRRAAAFPRGDVLGAVSVLSVVALLGLPLAWVWARLAPAQLSLVLSNGTLSPLPTESQHRFDDIALFVLIGLAAGVATGFAVWLLRQRRGPLTLLALAVGSLIAGWLAMRTGLSFAEGRYAAAVRSAAPNTVVPAVPTLESAWVALAQPLAAVLTYSIAAAINGLDDLGRRLS
jgi:Protein of unknown function (DUF2567)